MKNNAWYLYVVGTGSIDAARDLLARFVSTLRDQNLQITNVQVIEGAVYDDLANVGDSLDTGDFEDGWTIHAMGTGDVSTAYQELPTFLNEFKDADLQVMHSGIAQGNLRSDVVPAGIA